ncbi:acetyl-CoA carboxylase biotin carboxylase subunit [Photobacterium sp. J15]|uniref:acetyl-CoA carboxylase biotin carboxylase subunit n=1 Tax=Photobacterium sp. J15 TaxID=265901 RepID=UPI0007E31485|nr:acetyl-CoA carboxylase biotin carboxylase subunit [Photobacterium sp. J15]
MNESAGKKIQRLMVVNRGEIACRIISTAKKKGITTIAVYSDVDQKAKHVAMADEAILIGKAPAQDSYLNIPKIIEAAKRAGAEAIHPGYGFLSENARFAEACKSNDIIFIGPTAEAMLAMSSKSEAKTIMEKANVPLIPGYHGADNSTDKLLDIAGQIGYPVILKAALGGGGKGMRIINSAAEMPEAIAGAKRESKAAFGDDQLLIEKYLTQPRHIEIQVFADQAGNTIYLSDRDCSIQRRHQKIVEEAPAPGLSAELRQAMGQAAVDAAKAIGYVGAGTVEFLLDSNEQFYFMEMNTRLQVEHPVTELITRQDLVEWQIKIAEGSTLPLKQEDISHRGHAIEVRIYAEDPEQDFIPSSGQIHFLQEPLTYHNDQICIRLDSGIRQHDSITSYYDPILAKLIVWAEDRERATHELSSTLSDYRLIGLETNIPYLQRVIQHPAFQQAQLNTHFIDQYKAELACIAPPLFETGQTGKHSVAKIPKLALFAAVAEIEQSRHSQPFPDLYGWRLNQDPYSDTVINTDKGDCYKLSFQHLEDKTFCSLKTKLKKIATNNEPESAASLDIHLLSTTENPHNSGINDFQIEVNGYSCHFSAVYCQNRLHIYHDHWYDVFTFGHQADYLHSKEENNQAVAPLNGIVSTLLCQPGDTVDEEQPLLVIEAMKMEYTVRAPYAGTVTNIHFQPGDQVEHGEQLVSFK